MIAVDVDTDIFEESKSTKKKMVSDLLDEFHEAREAGATFREIADKHGVSHERVRQVLEGAGVSHDRGWSSQVKKDRLGAEIAEWLRANGPVTAAEVCERFDLSAQRLGDLIDNHGVSRRHVMAGTGRTGSAFSDEEIEGVVLSAWRRLRADIPSAQGLSVSSYDRVRLRDDPSPALITSRRPWREICGAAGVPCGTGRPSYKVKWTDDDLFGWINRYADSVTGRVTFDGYDIWRRGQDGAPSGALLRTRLRRKGYPTWMVMVNTAARLRDAGSE